ncbi:hypothetical protein LY04_00677 [Oceanimonas baumannii]|uniref:Uncharacterized protein n=1 Tax=Oceanimonas baumannii TaxID=129578 RepID=A0ABY2F3T2_9GAMM|nr:hypothetical protein LY04_00677 [Oceanimonas baumannii]
MYCDRDSCLPLRHLCEGTSPRGNGSSSRRHHGAFKPMPGPQTPEPTALDARLHGHDGRCCHPRIFLVTPAKTGVHPAGTTGLSNLCQGRKLRSRLLWMPVCTGMTADAVTPYFPRHSRGNGSPSRRHHGAFKPAPGPQTPEPTALDARLHGHDGRYCHPREGGGPLHGAQNVGIPSCLQSGFRLVGRNDYVNGHIRSTRLQGSGFWLKWPCIQWLASRRKSSPLIWTKSRLSPLSR